MKPLRKCRMSGIIYFHWSLCYQPIGLQLSEKWNLLKIYNRRYFPILNLNRDFHIFQGDWRLNLNNPCLPVYHTTLIVHTTTWLMFLKIPKYYYLTKVWSACVCVVERNRCVCQNIFAPCILLRIPTLNFEINVAKQNLACLILKLEGELGISQIWNESILYKYHFQNRVCGCVWTLKKKKKQVRKYSSDEKSSSTAVWSTNSWSFRGQCCLG